MNKQHFDETFNLASKRSKDKVLLPVALYLPESTVKVLEEVASKHETTMSRVIEHLVALYQSEGDL